MTAPKKKPTPSGRIPTGVGEQSYLVRGPSAMLDAMRRAAKREKMPQAEAWRRAARLWLLPGRIEEQEGPDHVGRYLRRLLSDYGSVAQITLFKEQAAAGVTMTSVGAWLRGREGGSGLCAAAGQSVCFRGRTDSGRD